MHYDYFRDYDRYYTLTDMPERLQQQQTALWELIKTEVAYIRTLKVVTDVSNFLCLARTFTTKSIPFIAISSVLEKFTISKHSKRNRHRETIL